MLKNDGVIFCDNVADSIFCGMAGDLILEGDFFLGDQIICDYVAAWGSST